MTQPIAPLVTITERVIAAAKARQTRIREAHTDVDDWADRAAQRRYLLVLDSLSVWAESPRRIIADVPDTRAAEIHGAGITAAVLDIDVSEHGAPIAWRDRAEIEQLSPTRAVLTF